MSISGNLRTLEFAELLQWLAQGQKTGALIVSNGSVEKRIYFKVGKIISSESNNPDEHLGQYMIREGLIDQATLSRAVKLQESTQILLGKVLVTLGTISEEELRRILHRKTEEGLYGLFNWTEGDFRFVPDDLPRMPMIPLEIDVTNVVLEGAKRFDEARRDSQLGSGNYGEEIENVLNSEIFQGIEVNESEADTPNLEAVPEVEETPEPLNLPETDEQREESSTEVRGYYSGTGKNHRGRTPMLAAAAAIAAVAIGFGAYFLMRPDPAVGVAEQESLASSRPLETSDDFAEIEDLYQPLDSAAEESDDSAVAESTEEPTAEPSRDLESEQVQARYEAELQALKLQLEQAQLAAAERDEAVGRVAELEDQVTQAREAALLAESPSEPEAQFRIASLQNPLEDSRLSAGGDEPPPLGTPQQTTEADHEAGTDFAAEMVDSAPTPLPVPAETIPPPVEESIEEVVTEALEAIIDAPVLLTRPKPRYPAAAMRMGKEAVVSLRLLIDTEGKVIDIERMGAAQGMGFDKAAINAALNTHWQPGTRDGEPAEMWAEMRIAFRL